ncbi:hypothetical protein BDB01DRAFT_846917 [Pilobolus umbonatus]|nr:hypothetical protein BDB01DRAFT_846917 [Pilobolus umbonatus]
MERCFACWHAFLKAEIDAGNLSKKVFQPINHYLVHIPHVIRHLGPMRAYSTGAMERNIESGNYNKFTKRQLDSTIFSTAIIQYYNRGSPNTRQNITLDNIDIAARAWINNTIYSTKNQHSSVAATISSCSRLTLTEKDLRHTGLLARLFSSSHTSIINQSHPLLVKVAKNHTQCKFNRFIPVVELFGKNEIPFFAVIDIGQITAQVGLVKNPQNDPLSVVSPYFVFDKDLSSAGRLSYL